MHPLWRADANWVRTHFWRPRRQPRARKRWGVEIVQALSGRRNRHADDGAAEEGLGKAAGCARLVCCGRARGGKHRARLHAALRAGARGSRRRPRRWPRQSRAAPPSSGCPQLRLVVDALGSADAGIFGDILCARMRQARRRRSGHRWRGARPRRRAGERDFAGVSQGTASPPSYALTFVAWQRPVGGGGVACFQTTWSWPMTTAPSSSRRARRGGGGGRRRTGTGRGLILARSTPERRCPGSIRRTRPIVRPTRPGRASHAEPGANEGRVAPPCSRSPT